MWKYEQSKESEDIITVTDTQTDVQFELIKQISDDFNGNQAVWFWCQVLKSELNRAFGNASVDSKYSREFAVVLDDDSFKVWKLFMTNPTELYEISGIEDKCLLFNIIQNFKVVNDIATINIIKE
jgi:hypothetical protein